MIIVVGNYKLKYNFESNSQLEKGLGISRKVGNYKLKYNFESNSQRELIDMSNKSVGNYKLKYNFESNSQPVCCVFSAVSGWEL